MTNGIEKRLVDIVIGGLAGVVATGPMTAVMILWHRRLPRREQYPLPPREIVMSLAEKTGVRESMSEEVRSAATLLAHFGYGGGAGAVYGALTREVPVREAWKGVVFGLVVWATSYLGLLPGARILHEATEHPLRRNALMIGGHVVWGVTLGLLAEILRQEAHGDGTQPLSKANAAHTDANGSYRLFWR